MNEERATPQNVTLYPTDRNIIERAIVAFQRKNISDAVQFIIRDWAQLKAELGEMELGKQARK